MIFRKGVDKLTPRRKKLIKLLIEHPDWPLAKIGRKVGFSDKSGKVYDITANALKSRPVRERIAMEMERNPKLRETALLRKLAEGLDATVTKVFSDKGNLVYSDPLVDYPTRRSYLELASQFNGITGGKEGPHTINNVVVMLKDSQLALIAKGKATPSDFLNLDGGQGGANPTGK